jgi:hypothetical protein
MNVKKLKAYLESPEGRKQTEEYFEKLAQREAIKEKRFERFNEWLKHNDFDKLLNRLILEHNDEYCEKCYHSGCEPYMNNKLDFVFDYAIKHGKKVKIKKLDCDFPNVISEFMGYYFQIVWGQGSITAIYNKDDLKQIFW